MKSATPSAAILGCSGHVLTGEERDFFARTNPLGFILFARNIDAPDQVRRLTADLRQAVERSDAPILIDQEGGRVQRLKPPHWRQAPPARVLGALYERDMEAGLRAIWLNHRLIAAELAEIGVDVDCVPCLDVPVPGAHDVIGDRAFSTDPQIVGLCGRIAVQGLMAGGILPVAKHLPGHGRATADSHHDLPRVSTSLTELRISDFVPFKALKGIPLGMTAHIVFEALDPVLPVTQSVPGIDFIRQEIGFDGLLMTDDLSMKALGGRFEDRASSSLAAGCDLVLHCNGDMTEMQAVMSVTGPMTSEAQRRWQGARSACNPVPGFDRASALEEFHDLML